MTLSAVEKDSDCTPGASILPKDLGAIPPYTGLGDGSPPARSRGRASVVSGAKPAETGKFMTTSFNFHAGM